MRTSALIPLFALITACAGTPEDDPAVTTAGTTGAPESTQQTPPDPGRQTADTLNRPPADTTSTTANGWTTGIVDRDHEVTGAALHTGVRVAQNEGFDRVVLEFQGEQLPAYRLEYIDRPVLQCGSGEPVEIAGDGWLMVRMQPTNAHTDEGMPTIVERALEPRLPIIREMRMICDFEAMVEWVIGVRSPNPYRVMELGNPTRLVVDIRR